MVVRVVARRRPAKSHEKNAAMRNEAFVSAFKGSAQNSGLKARSRYSPSNSSQTSRKCDTIYPLLSEVQELLASTVLRSETFMGKGDPRSRMSSSCPQRSRIAVTVATTPPSCESITLYPGDCKSKAQKGLIEEAGVQMTFARVV